MPVLKDAPPLTAERSGEDAAAVDEHEGANGSAAAPAAPVVPTISRSRARKRRRAPLARGVAIVALLVGLAVAGVLVGQAIRDEGEDARAPLQPPTTAPPASTPEPPPKWGPLTAVPSGRLEVPLERPAAAAAGERLAVLGGRSAGDPSAAVLLGPPQGSVARVATLPAPLAAGAPFVRPDAVYLIGGERGETVSDGIVRVDRGTGRVTFAGRFFEPLAGAGYVQAGESLVIVGGWTGEILATGVLRYSLDGDPALVTRLPVATRDPAVALHNGKVWVAGGLTGSGPTAAVYAIDLAAGTVSEVGRLPQPVSAATMVVSGGKLYVLGGRAAGGAVASVVRIDPATGAIASAGRMPAPLAGAAAVPIGEATYVVGGSRGTAGTSAAIHRIVR